MESSSQNEFKTFGDKLRAQTKAQLESLQKQEEINEKQREHDKLELIREMSRFFENDILDYLDRVSKTGSSYVDITPKPSVNHELFDRIKRFIYENIFNGFDLNIEKWFEDKSKEQGITCIFHKDPYSKYNNELCGVIFDWGKN